VREIARLQSWLAAGAVAAGAAAAGAAAAGAAAAGAGVAEGGVAEGGGPAMADGAPAREEAHEEEVVVRRRPRVCFST